MAGGKETPRQKMIGMMYLVLMALLAMNVSKEVLNSFIIINGAIENTNEAFGRKNQATFAVISNQKSQSPNDNQLEQVYNSAKSVLDAGNALNDSIDALKRFLIYKTEKAENEDAYVVAKSDGAATTYSPEVDSLFSIKKVEAKDNYDIPTGVMIGSDPANLKEGAFTATDLRKKLEDFSNTVMGTIPSRLQDSFRPQATFDFSDIVIDNAGKKEPWEMANFYHVPLAAVITNLSRLQSEINTMQSAALNVLLSEISAADFKFDVVKAKVIANSNYVTLGDSFKADVIVAAYSTSENPLLQVGDVDSLGKASSEWEVQNPVDESRISVKDGVAHYAYKPTSEGEVTWGGLIVLKDPLTGELTKKYAFEHTFIAAKPSTVVSPTKMNVVYRGLDNPVEVSVSGYAATRIEASTTNGSLTKVSPGKYTLKPGKGKECTVSVTVKDDKGGSKRIGEGFKFRVKNVPKPEPYYAGVTGSGKVGKARLQVASKVTAKLEDFDFEGVNYKVVGFDFVANVGGRFIRETSKSGNLSSKMKNIAKGQKKGDRIIIENIFAVGPDGTKKSIGNIILEVK